MHSLGPRTTKSMPSSRDFDHYTDAVLIAVLRLVAAREEDARSDGRPPLDPLLTSSGVEGVDDIIRAGQTLTFFEGDDSPQGIAAAERYRKYREAIDPLWRYVQQHGLPELSREASRRAALL